MIHFDFCSVSLLQKRKGAIQMKLNKILRAIPLSVSLLLPTGLLANAAEHDHGGSHTEAVTNAAVDLRAH